MRSAVPLAIAVFVLGCEGTPSDLREWTPSDHQHTAQEADPSAPQKQTPEGARGNLPEGLSEVALVTWRRNCVNCHGMLGRGDGPQGAMLKARDLANPEWQAQTTDEQIAEVIRKGKGTMPPSNLPDETVQGLVRLVRMLGGRRAQPAPPAASAGGTQPATSAPAP